MKITDWLRSRLPKTERAPEARPEETTPEKKKAAAPVREAGPRDLEAAYSSRHGKARARRYWARHLSANARGRKRTLRRIRRESKRANR